MKAYIAQLPPLAWVGVLLPLLVLIHLLLAAFAPQVLHAAVPASVSSFLRLL